MKWVESVPQQANESIIIPNDSRIFLYFWPRHLRLFTRIRRSVGGSRIVSSTPFRLSRFSNPRTLLMTPVLFGLSYPMLSNCNGHSDHPRSFFDIQRFSEVATEDDEKHFYKLCVQTLEYHQHLSWDLSSVNIFIPHAILPRAHLTFGPCTRLWSRTSI